MGAIRSFVISCCMLSALISMQRVPQLQECVEKYSSIVTKLATIGFSVRLRYNARRTIFMLRLFAREEGDSAFDQWYPEPEQFLHSIQPYQLDEILLFAVQLNYIQSACSLIEWGAHIDMCNADDESLLCIAVNNESVGMVRMLLEKGAGETQEDEDISEAEKLEYFIGENDGLKAQAIIQLLRAARGAGSIGSQAGQLCDE